MKIFIPAILCLTKFINNIDVDNYCVALIRRITGLELSVVQHGVSSPSLDYCGLETAIETL